MINTSHDDFPTPTIRILCSEAIKILRWKLLIYMTKL